MTWDGYDRGITDSEANEWKEELRKQKLPDEPVWHSVVKHSEPESDPLLSIKVFRQAGGGANVYLRRLGQTDPGDYELTKHETIGDALIFCSFAEGEAMAKVIEREEA